MAFTVSTILFQIVSLAILGIFLVTLFLLLRALLQYLRTNTARKENAAVRQSLGEALQAERKRCRMTQEFVSERLGVSRQAVSKWENGSSEPSTSNLLRLAKLYGVSAEALLKQIEPSERTAP